MFLFCIFRNKRVSSLTGYPKQKVNVTVIDFPGVIIKQQFPAEGLVMHVLGKFNTWPSLASLLILQLATHVDFVENCLVRNQEEAVTSVGISAKLSSVMSATKRSLPLGIWGDIIGYIMRKGLSVWIATASSEVQTRWRVIAENLASLWLSDSFIDLHDAEQNPTSSEISAKQEWWLQLHAISICWNLWNQSCHQSYCLNCWQFERWLDRQQLLYLSVNWRITYEAQWLLSLA